MAFLKLTVKPAGRIPWQPKGCWVTPDNVNFAQFQHVGFVFGQECSSLKDVEAIVAEIRSNLDEILLRAQGYFGS
jgi:hypothetical protein